MRYKAVCFDIDGTLYPISVMNRRLFALSVAHPIFASRYMRGRKKFRRLQHGFEGNVRFRQREAMVIEGISDSGASGWEKTGERLEKWFYRPMERLYRKTGAFDGVRETFLFLRKKGVKVGVFSDFPLFSKLEGMNLADLVDFAASSDDVGFLKPDGHCFEYLLYNLKMDASDVLYVGDSYEKDIVGASGAGMDAVLISAQGGDYPLAKAVFRTWKEFDAWLSAGMEDRG